MVNRGNKIILKLIAIADIIRDYRVLTLLTIMLSPPIFCQTDGLYKTNTQVSINDSTLLLVDINKFPNLTSLLTSSRIIKRFSYSEFIVKSKNGSFESHRRNLNFANNYYKISDNALENINLKNDEILPVIVYRENKGIVSIQTEYLTKKGIFLLTENDHVKFIEAFRFAHAEAIQNNLDLTTNNITAVQALFPSLKGSDIVVSLKEDDFNVDDIDLIGRASNSSTASTFLSQHATDMATIIGGRGNSFIRGLGVAPSVYLSSTNFNSLSPDPISQLARSQVSIQNHSYGVNIENYYGIEAQLYDQEVYDADTLIHVFSSGNIGDSASPSGIYSGLKGVANLTGTFKQSKNTLIVGGTDNYSNVAIFSSRGPAYDGRLKPDLVAVGPNGTSGSAALVAGVCALISESYRQLMGQPPSAALIKASLICSADNAQNIDFSSGYGHLNALNAVRIIENKQFKNDIVANGNTNDIILTVPDSIELLKIALSWVDLPAEINAPKALINDLDLSIIDLSGLTIHPWVLNEYPALDSLSTSPKKGLDSTNNSELITIERPSPGPYTIRVVGKKVKTNQKFSVCWQFSKKIFPACAQ